MRLPNLLASKNGRLTAFFFLYLTEGIPLGFTAIAIATQMRRQGLGPEVIGAFVGSLYLPWALKWIAGPFVDVFTSDRLGRRRVWIVSMQVAMALVLLATVPIDFVGQLKLFTLLIFLHNCFAATMDVAIDSLAVNTLHESERGLANGLMFGGAYLGQMLGGAGVLFLTPYIGFQSTYFVVAAWILAVTLLIALPLQEARVARATGVVGSRLAAAGREVWGFLADAFRAFTGTRAAFLGVFFALLPAGAYALSLSLQSNLAVELGLNDTQLGWLNLWSAILSAGFCVLGGWISDRLGRRRSLALFIACTALPTFYLAWAMQQYGWILPISPTAPDRPVPAAALVQHFWIAALVHSVFTGLRYGVGTAIFMDITTPRVAATQFTAYMAMSNLAIAYSATWQGWFLARRGYPLTLVLDCAVGVVGLAVLAFMSTARRRAGEPRTPLVPSPEALPEAIQP